MCIRVTELLGDGIGPELRESVYAVADVLPIDFEFIPFDLSLGNRESGDRDLFDKLVESMKQTKLSIKYPTVTNVSSPNAIIRRMCNFSVILRPVISIKGIKSNFTEEAFKGLQQNCGLIPAQVSHPAHHSSYSRRPFW